MTASLRALHCGAARQAHHWDLGFVRNRKTRREYEAMVDQAHLPHPLAMQRTPGTPGDAARMVGRERPPQRQRPWRRACHARLGILRPSSVVDAIDPFGTVSHAWLRHGLLPGGCFALDVVRRMLHAGGCVFARGAGLGRDRLRRHVHVGRGNLLLALTCRGPQTPPPPRSRPALQPPLGMYAPHISPTAALAGKRTSGAWRSSAPSGGTRGTRGY